MKSTLFVRPNLKVFVIGAVLIAVLNGLLSNWNFNASARNLSVVNARTITNQDLQKLADHAEKFPTSQAFYLLSNYYEKQGDYRKALLYLRKAEKVAQWESDNE